MTSHNLLPKIKKRIEGSKVFYHPYPSQTADVEKKPEKLLFRFKTQYVATYAISEEEIWAPDVIGEETIMKLLS